MSLKKSITFFVILLSGIITFAQTQAPAPAERKDYVSLMAGGDYAGALKILLPRIEEINGTRVDEKRIPSDFITLGGGENEGVSRNKQLNRMFRERKAAPFFIEDNRELYDLHRSAGKCLYETRSFDEALNHYYQSLRFHQPSAEDDAEVFYNIAQVYLGRKQITGYCDAMESAIGINPRKQSFLLEVGRVLYRTRDVKRAIFYLERYQASRGNELKELDVLTMLAGLSENVGKYLDSQKYYQLYLAKKNDDGFIHFALGDIACHRTGNFRLADDELRKAIQLLPETEIYRRAKAYEFMGDMAFDLLKFDAAEAAYLETIKYQDKVLTEIGKNDQEIARIDGEIRTLKSALLKEKNYVQFNEYQFQLQEKERVLSERKERKYEYDKLNPGKCRWNIAEACERRELLDRAIGFYRQCITFNHRMNEAREKIVKIQLKIKRGY